MAETSKSLELIIAARTQEAEAALKRVRDNYASITPATTQAAAAFRNASNALDVRPMRAVSIEINELRQHYKRLSESGLLSQRELAQAATNLKAKTDQLRASFGQLDTAQTGTAGSANRMASGLKNLLGAYLGYQAITKTVGAIATATRDAETAQFGLQASVQAAGREFENTGGLDMWQGKVKELSADLRIYSETDVANAAARTIDMTKRLGLSADQMDTLIRRTADLSAGKTDLEGGIERVTAALRGEAEASEFLGLTLNETYVKSWYEANTVTGKAWKNLTDLEKAQVRYNVMLEQTAATQGRAAESVRTFNGALALVKSQVANAIANNENFGNAMQRVATLLSDNADEIADFAAALTSAIGDIVEFVIKNKEIVGTLAGAGGLIATLGKTSGAVASVGAVMQSVGKTKTPEILGSGGSLNAALLARIGLLGLLVGIVGKTILAYVNMRAAQEDAAAAEQRAADSAAYAQGVANAAAASTGLQIDSIQQLNQLLRDGAVVRDATAGQYLTIAQAEAKAAAEADRAAAGEARRAESFAAVNAIVEQAAAKFGDLSEATVNAADRQERLDAALAASATAAELSAASVEGLGDAYVDASRALDSLSQGQEGYEAALERKLDAEKAYTKAVADLKKSTMNAAEEGYQEEERALKQSLELRLLAEQERLEQGFITETEFAKLKAENEKTLSSALLKMREELVAKSAELYGKDSDEYRAAVADKIDAEIELKKVVAETRKALDANIGVARESRKSSESLADSLRAVGPAGREGADVAAQGMSELTEYTEEATESQRKLTEEQKKQARADYFGAQYTGIQQQIASFKSLEEAQKWANQVVTQKNGRTYTNKDLMSMGGAGVAGQSAFTRSANKYAEQLYIQKLNELSRQAPTKAPGETAAAPGKMMTVNLKAGSQTVATTLPEADAGRLLEVLRQAGMVTA